MATIQEVSNFMVSCGGALVELKSESFVINYPFDNGRDQLLICYSDQERKYLTCISPFADINKVSAETVVRLGNLFGVITHGNYYALATTVPLETIDELEVRVILNGMVYMADTYEKQLSGGNDL
jgi:hypothetical protein